MNTRQANSSRGRGRGRGRDRGRNNSRGRRQTTTVRSHPCLVSECDSRGFTSVGLLARHLRQAHVDELPLFPSDVLDRAGLTRCSGCEGVYTVRGSLIHAASCSVSTLMCPVDSCVVESDSITNVACHLRAAHDGAAIPPHRLVRLSLEECSGCGLIYTRRGLTIHARSCDGVSSRAGSSIPPSPRAQPNTFTSPARPANYRPPRRTVTTPNSSPRRTPVRSLLSLFPSPGASAASTNSTNTHFRPESPSAPAPPPPGSDRAFDGRDTHSRVFVPLIHQAYARARGNAVPGARRFLRPVGDPQEWEHLVATYARDFRARHVTLQSLRCQEGGYVPPRYQIGLLYPAYHGGQARIDVNDYQRLIMLTNSVSPQPIDLDYGQEANRAEVGAAPELVDLTARPPMFSIPPVRATGSGSEGDEEKDVSSGDASDSPPISSLGDLEVTSSSGELASSLSRLDPPQTDLSHSSSSSPVQSGLRPGVSTNTSLNSLALLTSICGVVEPQVCLCITCVI